MELLASSLIIKSNKSKEKIIKLFENIKLT